MKIPDEIIPTAYDISRKVYDRELTAAKGRSILGKTININSAGDYISNFRYLMKGEKFQRTLNSASMDYFLNNIFKQYGEKGLSNALSALKKHINYYEGQGKKKTTMINMRSLYDKFSSKVNSGTLIINSDQLQRNIATVEHYLTEGSDSERTFVAKLIQNGICFVAYKAGNEVRFAPSRFLGYANNTVEMHSTSVEKDGRETNQAINTVLLSKLQTDHLLEGKYLEYCKKLGIKPNVKSQSSRKFWDFELAQDFQNNSELTGEFPEGKMVERTHMARERNYQVVKIAKEDFKTKHGRLFCEVCEFDFEKTYGRDANDFIEAHHTIPVSEMPPDHKTKPEDIAMLCANCHRIVHKKRPWLTISQLRQLFLLMKTRQLG